ncbi:MAG: hypothetical protein ABW079_15330 [Sedimenticola sp.]
MKYFIITPIALLFVVLTGCTTMDAKTSPKGKSVIDLDAKISPEYRAAYDVTLEKLKKNGPDIFCTQQEYIDCFNITSTQCQLELPSIHNFCFKTAFKEYDRFKIYKDFQDASKYYSSCVVARHVVRYSHKRESIIECLHNAKPDEKLMMNEMLK